MTAAPLQAFWSRGFSLSPHQASALDPGGLTHRSPNPPNCFQNVRSATAEAVQCLTVCVGRNRETEVHCCGGLWNCCRLSVNSNKNHSQVAWDCYYRACPDQPAAVRPSSTASVAAAELSCTGDQQQDPQSSSPETPQPVSDDDDNRQIVAQAVCSQFCLCICTQLALVFIV